jgi:hypothetical protein
MGNLIKKMRSFNPIISLSVGGLICIIGLFISIFFYPKETRPSLIFELTIACISTIFTMVTIIVSVQIFKKQDENEISKQEKSQLDLLKTFECVENEVRLAVEGHCEELHKNKQIPSYFIPSFSAMDYITKLDTNIKNIRTDIFKQLLIKIENKIENINRLVYLAQESSTYRKDASLDRLIKELKQKSYYQDLIDLFHEKPWQELKLLRK